MEKDNLINSLGAVIVIVGSVMKILHLPYANSILFYGFIGIAIVQSWHVSQLKKRIKELESKLEN